MSRSPLVILAFAAAMLSLRDSRAKVPEPPLPEPPLPGEEGPVSPGEAFSLLPGPDNIPPESLAPGEENPVVPPPEAGRMDELPDIDPLGLPSDGEPMPELPVIPGLTLPTRPKGRPAAQENGLTPGQPESLPDLLPAPGFQLAQKSRWYKSPLEARRVSIAERKPLLIFFAQKREGDCPTILLNNDLMTMPEFNDFASASLILTKLQYPGVSSPNKRDYPDEKLEALKKFQDYFKVKGFPTLILIDENGRELQRVKGYRRVKDRNEQEYSTAHVILDQLKETMRRYDERRRYQQQRIDNLTSQGFRIWTSRAGSTMMGRLVEAKPDRIILMDENNHWRQVLPSQLILFDAEWARRKQAGLIPDKSAASTAIAAVPLPTPPPVEALPAPADKGKRQPGRDTLGGKPAAH